MQGAEVKEWMFAGIYRLMRNDIHKRKESMTIQRERCGDWRRIA